MTVAELINKLAGLPPMMEILATNETVYYFVSDIVVDVGFAEPMGVIEIGDRVHATPPNPEWRVVEELAPIDARIPIGVADPRGIQEIVEGEHKKEFWKDVSEDIVGNVPSQLRYTPTFYRDSWDERGRRNPHTFDPSHGIRKGCTTCSYPQDHPIHQQNLPTQTND